MTAQQHLSFIHSLFCAISLQCLVPLLLMAILDDTGLILMIDYLGNAYKRLKVGR